MSDFETGAKTAAANNLVLSVLNDGAIYQDRLHCGFAMMQGSTHRIFLARILGTALILDSRKSFRDLVTAEANKQRRMGGKFKAAEISEAANLVKAATIEHCLEFIRDEYNPLRLILANCRKWRDNINGNTYFSVLVQIPCGADGYRRISIPFQYGYGDQWMHETMSVLSRVLCIDAPNWPREAPIAWNFEGVMRKRDMYKGIYL